MNYLSFFEWFNIQFKKDWVYLKEDCIYSFNFSYSLSIINKEDLEYIKPKFPWNETLLYDLAKKTSNESYYIEVIKKQEEEIKKLKKELENIKKK